MNDVDKKLGIYRKFEVRRTDGRDALGEKHHGCHYFVLDLNHDKHAVASLNAYAESCLEEFPKLSQDLVMMAQRMKNGFPPLAHLREKKDA